MGRELALKGHFAAASLVFRGLWGGRGHESMNWDNLAYME